MRCEVGDLATGPEPSKGGDRYVAVEVATLKEQHVLGEPVRLIVTVKNISQETLAFPGTLWRHYFPRLQVTGPSAKEPGRPYRRWVSAPRTLSILVCQPGQSDRLEVLLSKIWKLDAPGTYTCHWKLKLTFGPPDKSHKYQWKWRRSHEAEGKTDFRISPRSTEQLVGTCEQLAEQFRGAYADAKREGMHYAPRRWAQPLETLLSVSDPVALPIQLRLANDYFSEPTAVKFVFLREMPRSDDPRVVRFLERFATCRFSLERSQLASEIDSFPSHCVRHLVERLANDRDPHVRQCLLSGHETAEDGESNPAVLRPVAARLYDPDERIRARAAGILGNSGQMAAIGDLRARLESEQFGSVRMEIRGALQKLGAGQGVALEESVDWDALRQELKTGDETRRLAIAQQLGSMKRKEAAEILLDLSQDPSGTVRAAALIGLGRSGAEGISRDTLSQRLLEATKSDDAFAVLHALANLSKLAPKDYVAQISPLIKSQDRTIRFASAMYLRNASTPEALQALEDAATVEKDAQVLSVIRKALEAAEKQPEPTPAPRPPAD